MDNPTQSLLAYFTKLCLDKTEFPCFDRKGLIHFCYDAKKDYPEIFDKTNFYKQLTTYSEEIDDELFRLGICRLLFSYGPNFHPHQTSKKLVLLCQETPLKYDRPLSELSQKFYDELGCDTSGVLKKHSPMSLINLEQLE